MTELRLFSIDLMDEDRRARFIDWFSATYRGADARSRFMADSAQTGEEAYSKGRVSQFFKKGQPFGERAAREIESRFFLPPRYLEPEGGAPSVDGVTMALSPAEREVILLLRKQGHGGASPLPPAPPPVPQPYIDMYQRMSHTQREIWYQEGDTLLNSDTPSPAFVPDPLVSGAKVKKVAARKTLPRHS